MYKTYDKCPSWVPAHFRELYDNEKPAVRWRYLNERCITRAELDREVHLRSLDKASEMLSDLKKTFAGLAALVPRSNSNEKTIHTLPVSTLRNSCAVDWKEEEHPRAKDGKFTTGSGSSFATDKTDSSPQQKDQSPPRSRKTAPGSSDTREEKTLVSPARQQPSTPVAADTPPQATASGSGLPIQESTSTRADAVEVSTPPIESQRIKKAVEALGYIVPDEKKLHSGSIRLRKDAVIALLCLANEVEFAHKDAELAHSLREMGRGAVPPSFYLTNYYTTRRARSAINQYLTNELSTAELYKLPLNEKAAALILLGLTANKTEKKDAMLKSLVKNIVHNEALAQAYRDAYKTRDGLALHNLRSSLIPKAYKQETQSKVDSLINVLTDSTSPSSASFKKDSDAWAAMSRDDKKATLNRWLAFFLAHFDLKGEHRFAWTEGEGNIRVLPYFETNELYDNILKFAAEDDIIVPGSEFERIEKLPLYKALYPIVHEVMHLYEVQHMNDTLNNQGATMEEADYALRFACSFVGKPEPDLNAGDTENPSPKEVAYHSYLPESSAVYFSTRYLYALQEMMNPTAGN